MPGFKASDEGADIRLGGPRTKGLLFLGSCGSCGLSIQAGLHRRWAGSFAGRSCEKGERVWEQRRQNHRLSLDFDLWCGCWKCIPPIYRYLPSNVRCFQSEIEGQHMHRKTSVGPEKQRCVYVSCCGGVGLHGYQISKYWSKQPRNSLLSTLKLC